MLNHMRIGQRLAVGFIVPLLLMAAIAAVGTLRLSQLTDNLDLVINDRNQKIAQANDVVDALNVIARAMRNTLLESAPDKIKRELDRIAEQRKIIGDRLEKLDATIATPQGKEALKAIKEMRAAYVPQQDRFLELVSAGKRDEASSLMLGTIRKQQADYFKTINDMIALLNGITASEGKAAIENAHAAQKLMIGLAILAALLTVIFAVIITRSIARPVAQVADAASKMAEGDFNFTLNSDNRDEIGEVVRAVAAVQTSVQSMSSDVGELVRAAIAGKLSTRADTNRHQGDFKQIVQGINATLDAVVGPLNVAAGYVDRIARGDVPPAITDSYNGDFNTLKNNLNTCIAALNTLIAEMNRMSQQHDLGDIDIRIEEGNFQGAYRAMAQGVNEMVFGHIAVKKKAMACIREFGEGNMDAALETFPGKKRFINETIEQVRKNIKALVADARLLSAAAVAGKLDTRADAAQHQGDFRRIVEGVNDTLDAVVSPIQDVQRVMTAMAAGDMTQTISKSYQGDFATLKDS
ncbi:MAG: MCP four helix bundle domain-containing protein, partial [Azonexus sp.]